MGFHGRAATHKPKIIMRNAKRQLEWCIVRRHWSDKSHVSITNRSILNHITGASSHSFKLFLRWIRGHNFWKKFGDNNRCQIYWFPYPSVAKFPQNAYDKSSSRTSLASWRFFKNTVYKKNNLATTDNISQLDKVSKIQVTCNCQNKGNTSVNEGYKVC